MIESNLKNDYSAGNDNIRILNPKQAAFYWGNGLKPLDIYPGKSRTGEHILIYIFSRQATQDSGVYAAWCDKKAGKYEKQI